jgi:hypothetical protein
MGFFLCCLLSEVYELVANLSIFIVDSKIQSMAIFY